MSCNDCGECRYSNNSTARVFVKVTSAGLEEGCQPDRESLFAGLTYSSPGIWARTFGNNTVTAKSRCVSGAWTWTQTHPAPPPGLCILGSPDGVTTQVLQDDCAGYHRIQTSTYSNGSWIKEEMKITVENNAECE